MADKLYFMIRDLYAIHSNVVKRQQDPTQEKQQQVLQQQQVLEQQQEQVLQQHFQHQLQQQQLQINTMEVPNSFNGWSLPFFNSTLINGGFEFEGSVSTNNIFQLPEGYDQPLMFPSRDVHNSM